MVVWLAGLAFGPGFVGAQDRGNPFEITSRLPQIPGPADTVNARQLGPFDIRRPADGRSSPPPPAPAFRAQNEPGPGARPGSVNASGPLVIQSADPNKDQGAILAIQLLLLVGLAAIWVLFGDLLRQAFRGVFNEAMMNQVYTRRSGGEMTALWICYLFAFLTGGLFLLLVTRRYGLRLPMGIWPSWFSFTLLVAGAVGLKQWVIWAMGRLFSLRKEVGRYAFVLMVFSILGGILLVPINLGLSYAPAGARVSVLYGGLGLLLLCYFLHLLRGLLIAGPYVATRPVHILLYICAIEIAPVLLLYRYLSNALV